MVEKQRLLSQSAVEFDETWLIGKQLTGMVNNLVCHYIITQLFFHYLY